MLFGYPIAATAQNWLHDCLCEMVTTIHANHDAGQPVPDWPVIVPSAYRERLAQRRGLGVRLMEYSSAAARLSGTERESVLACLGEQNMIADLLRGASKCEQLNALPSAIRQPAKKLFSFAFELLTDLGVRDTQYDVIFKAIKRPVCPFCGCEYFDNPKAQRENLDHYLAESLYPFAAANLRNLVPMGTKCNKAKRNQDILNNGGVRRKSFDPYSTGQVAVLLDNSIPFAGRNKWSMSCN